MTRDEFWNQLEVERSAQNKLFSMNYNLLKSRTFWSMVVVIAYNFFTTLVPLFPNVAWITLVVNVLGFLSASYFHVAGIKAAAGE